MRVLPDGRLRREEGAELLPVRRRGVFPIFADRVPACAQASLIGIAILRDDRRDSLRMLNRQTEAGWCAVIEDVDGIAIEADDIGEAVDRIRDPVKGAAPARHVGSAESRQVGSDDMETIVEARNEVAEHMARTRKSVKQQQLRGLRRARLPIEDMETINVGRAVPDGGHGDAPQRFSPTVPWPGIFRQSNAPIQPAMARPISCGESSWT